MPPGATVCLSHPHFMHQQNFVCLYFHSSNARKQKEGGRGGGAYHKRWYLRPAPEMGQRERCDIVLSHTANIDRDPISRCLSPSLCLCSEIHQCTACCACICMYCTYLWVFACTHRCRHHWVSASEWVCVSQRVSVSVWVVSTRNNTLPWDLLNGHHLSLSGKALGKLMLELRCFFTSGQLKWSGFITLEGEERETAKQIWEKMKYSSSSEKL